jgi:non-ribosomal peptide synthase protein (TIGR01720 family)
MAAARGASPGVSWRILLEDFATAHGAASAGAAIELPPKTTSFRRWAELLSEHARSAVLRQEISYWLAAPAKPPARLPVDRDDGDNVVASTDAVHVSLTAQETSDLLQRVPGPYRTTIDDALLTALVQALLGWTGAASVLIDVEGHGRADLFERVDVSRTVGWFTAKYPLIMSLDERLPPGEALKAVKEQRRAVPGQGLGYGLLRYLSGDADVEAQLRAAAEPEVYFNYLGQFGAGPDGGDPAHARSPGPTRSPRQRRRHLLEIDASVSGGRFEAVWTFSEARHARATIERVAEGFTAALRALIGHCLSPEAGGVTPSDFKKAHMSQRNLDKLLARLGG